MPTAISRDRSALAPALRAWILAAVTLLCTPASAQFGDLMRRVLVGDTLAPPDHDTAYIITYRQKATLSLVASARLAAGLRFGRPNIKGIQRFGL